MVQKSAQKYSLKIQVNMMMIFWFLPQPVTKILTDLSILPTSLLISFTSLSVSFTSLSIYHPHLCQYHSHLCQYHSHLCQYNARLCQYHSHLCQDHSDFCQYHSHLDKTVKVITQVLIPNKNEYSWRWSGCRLFTSPYFFIPMQPSHPCLNIHFVLVTELSIQLN